MGHIAFKLYYKIPGTREILEEKSIAYFIKKNNPAYLELEIYMDCRKIGYTEVKIWNNEDDKGKLTLIIDDIYIVEKDEDNEKFRHRGYGSKLVLETEKIAQKVGVKRIIGEARGSNSQKGVLKDFYEKLGYVFYYLNFFEKNL